MKEIKRGDVLYIDLGQHTDSSIQFGVRPCSVISNNMNNRYSTNLCVCPFSSKLKENPVHVRVNPEDVDGYFLRESDCLAEEIVTVDKKRVLNKIGHISEDSDVMRAINRAVWIQLGMANVN